MHVMKLKTASCKKLADEAIDRVGSRVGSIDHDKSSLNYNVCPHDPPSYAPGELDAYIRDTLGVTRKIQTDAVREVAVIIDYPRDETMPPEQFFRTAYDGLKQFFNLTDEKVAYSIVHMDETHPHMHMCFFPVIEKSRTKKDGTTVTRQALCAKEVVTRATLKQLHPEMQKYMHEHGATGTLLHNDGVVRDKDFLTYKLEAQQKALQEMETKAGIVADMKPAAITAKPVPLNGADVRVNKKDLDALRAKAGQAQSAIDRAVKAEAKVQTMQKEQERMRDHEAVVRKRELELDATVNRLTAEKDSQIRRLTQENRKLAQKVTTLNAEVDRWKNKATDLAAMLYTAIRGFTTDIHGALADIWRLANEKSPAEVKWGIGEIDRFQQDTGDLNRNGEER